MSFGKTLSLEIDFDKDRIYGLDILRCLAISIVVITHGEKYCSALVKNMIERTALDGVSIFFVLSGFLIGRILIKTMSYENLNINTLITFWWRRWLRTLPVYFSVLSFFILAYNYHKPPGPTFKRFYIFSQNLFTPQPPFFIEAWSLSVEEWFYLLVPVLIFIFIKYIKIKPPTAFVIVCVLVIIFSTALRIERYHAITNIDNIKFEFFFRMQVVTRLDSLMFGVVGAFCSVFYHNSWVKNKSIKFLIGVVILIINKLLTFYYMSSEGLIMYHTVFYFSLNSIGTLLTLPYLSNYRAGKGLIYQLVTYISIISYSMYLINLTPLQDFIIPFINKYVIQYFSVGNLQTIDLFLFYTLAIILSIYSYKFIEQPFLKLRDKVNLSRLTVKSVV